jgi:hypothetical protein
MLPSFLILVICVDLQILVHVEELTQLFEALPLAEREEFLHNEVKWEGSMKSQGEISEI